MDIALEHLVQHGLWLHIASEVEDRVAIIVQQHLHDVLTDVVDVALDRGQHDRALVRDLVCGHEALDGIETRARGLGGGHELRQEELALVEAVAHLVERGDELLVDELHGIGRLEQFLGKRRDLALAARDYQLANGAACTRARPRRQSPRRARRARRVRARSARSTRADGNLVRVGPAGISLDEGHRALVLGVEHTVGAHGIHVARAARVHDRRIQAGTERGREKRGVQQLARGQAEAHVGDAERALHTQALLAHAHRAQDLLHLALVGRGGHDQAVDEDALGPDPPARGLAHDAPGDGEAGLSRLGNAVLVERQADHVRAVVRHDGEDLVHDLALAVHRVDDGLAGVAAYGGLHGGGVGGIDLQG